MVLNMQFRYSFNHPRSVVWRHLQDEQVLQRTLPGCKRLQSRADGAFDAELGLDVGPIKGMFSGEVRLLEQVEPEHYRLLLLGSGKPGELHADSLVSLIETNAGTEIECAADIQVTGLLASVGQRVMGSVARMLLGRFFKNVDDDMKTNASLELPQ